MVLRMYLRWAEDKGFKAVITELSEGKSRVLNRPCTPGEYLGGCGPRRAFTACASRPRLGCATPHQLCLGVYSPEIDDNVDIEINPADLRLIPTARPVPVVSTLTPQIPRSELLTCLPTLAQCQSERSQHQNKDRHENVKGQAV